MLAITVAIILNEIRIKAAKQAYQTVILIPHPDLHGGGELFGFCIFESGNGFLNKTVLPMFGIDPISWYNAPQYWPFILVLINIWKGIGYSCIFVLCNHLRHRPQSVRGGCGGWRQPLAAGVEHYPCPA